MSVKKGLAMLDFNLTDILFLLEISLCQSHLTVAYYPLPIDINTWLGRVCMFMVDSQEIAVSSMLSMCTGHLRPYTH